MLLITPTSIAMAVIILAISIRTITTDLTFIILPQMKVTVVALLGYKFKKTLPSFAGYYSLRGVAKIAPHKKNIGRLTENLRVVSGASAIMVASPKSKNSTIKGIYGNPHPRPDYRRFCFDSIH